MLNPTNATAAATTPAATAELRPEGQSEDFDKFLTLMTAQMRQQDPLKPLDSTEFVAQLATFSSVEQQIKTNAKLDEVLASLTGGGVDGALRYLGRDVATPSATLSLPEKGDASFRVELPEGAGRAVLRVVDAAGRPVREMTLSATDGVIAGRFDGRTDEGARLPAGSYGVEASVLNDNGELGGPGVVLTEATVAEARVGADGEATLLLDDGRTVAPSEVRAIMN